MRDIVDITVVVACMSPEGDERGRFSLATRGERDYAATVQAITAALTPSSPEESLADYGRRLVTQRSDNGQCLAVSPTNDRCILTAPHPNTVHWSGAPLDISWAD